MSHKRILLNAAFCKHLKNKPVSDNGSEKNYNFVLRRDTLPEPFTSGSGPMISNLILDGGGRATGGIRINKDIVCPVVDIDTYKGLSCINIDTVTKHLDRQGYEGSLNGSFLFKCLSIFRSAEEKSTVIDRFSDEQEGRNKKTINSKTNVFENIDIGGLNVNGVKMIGLNEQISQYLYADAYCACLSRNEFKQHRLDTFRQNGNKDLEYFVTYDLHKLLIALDAVVQESGLWQSHLALSRPVVYSVKDSIQMVESSAKYFDSENAISAFLKIAFVKDTKFSHEDEYRILMASPSSLGKLAGQTQSHIFRDQRIADAIVSHGRGATSDQFSF
ncbi:hypothetical protein [Brucella rhizosphaerae]|uniref:hypothetical protein n=1 Tax=Brucella rhizosphaerae TaxID=571254 RepID=UPI00361EA000